jgi:hypothetical protein
MLLEVLCRGVTLLGAIFGDDNHAVDKTCRAALPR